jgi:hypothetical protein
MRAIFGAIGINNAFPFYFQLFPRSRRRLPAGKAFDSSRIQSPTFARKEIRVICVEDIVSELMIRVPDTV